MPVTYLETGTQNPFYNLAFEEFVLTHRLEGEYLFLPFFGQDIRQRRKAGR